MLKYQAFDKNMQTIKFTNFCLVMTLFLISSFSEVNGQNLTIKPYVFENGKKEKVDAEFGRLKVPENRLKKNSKKIEIAFVRFKSTSNNPGSPIVYLAGGPGGSGIGSAKFSRFKLFMAMREFGDVIALDQRGTGAASPNLRCKEKIDLPMDKPLTPESFAKEELEKTRACASKWEANGIDVSAYNTIESASDINDLRLALGAKKVSLWGISYGTHLALATIRQHGKYIDRAILAGVEGVDDTLKLPSYTQNLMVELNKRVKADAKLSKKIPDFLGLIKTVHDRLDRDPVTVELTDPKTKEKTKVGIGKFDVQGLVAAFSGSNEAQSLFPKLYYDMSNGDFTFVAQQMWRFRKGGLSPIMSIAMDCASGISPQRSALIKREKQTALFSDAVNVPFPKICEAVNYRKLGKDFRKPVKSDVPVLFISGTLDGRTPVSNAEFTRKGFKNNTHLIINGAGHSDPLFLSTPKTAKTMFSFMKEQKLARTINIDMTKPFRFVPITENPTAENETSRKIDNFISPFAKANHFSGVVLVTRDNEVVYEKAFGLANVEHGVPNKLDTKFGIASITKPMTSVIFLRLIEQGKIGINDKVSKYIPDFPSGDKITLGMLGRHRSGIPHRVMPPEEEAKRYTPAQFVEQVKKAKLEFEPGEKELYSSAGYATLARVLEIASGKSFQTLLKEFVFKPAGMNETLDYDSQKIINNKAESYFLEGNGYTASPLKDYSFLVGAGSVFSTARDVQKFAQAAYEGKFGKNARTNLIRKGEIFRSNGSTNGYRANIRIDRGKKFGYVIVSNLGSGANDLVINNIRSLLEGKEMEAPKIPTAKVDRTLKNPLPNYMGRYRLGGSGFDILIRDGELFAGPFKLLPIGKDKFYSYWNYAEITFVRDETGKVKGLKWIGSGGKSDWSRQ